VLIVSSRSGWQKSTRTQVYINVTHWVCTHCLSAAMISGDACQHSDSIWSCDSPYSRGAGDQSGGSGRALRVAPDVLQRHRARSPERLAGKHRKGVQRPKNLSARPIQPSLISGFLAPELAQILAAREILPCGSSLSLWQLIGFRLSDKGCRAKMGGSDKSPFLFWTVGI